jgi:N-acetylmuramic acid 6-phosphate etherase
MVDVLATNQKLRDRARRIVAEICKVGPRAAQKLLKQAGGRPKLAIAIHALDVSAAEAQERLDEAGGDLHKLLDGKSKTYATKTKKLKTVPSRKRRRR